MSAINSIALVTGYLSLGVIVLFFGWIAWEFAVGFCKACSLTRFYLAVARKNRTKLSLAKFPKFFLKEWVAMSTRSPKITGQGGYWNGIGDWKAYKKRECQ